MVGRLLKAACSCSVASLNQEETEMFPSDSQTTRSWAEAFKAVESNNSLGELALLIAATSPDKS